MRILILGGDGMLGHELLQHLAPRHDVRVTLRRALGAYAKFNLFTSANADGDVDARSFDRVAAVVGKFRPDAVINTIGIVKQRPEALDAIASIEINSLLPHRLALLCGGQGGQLIHISTDCVFSGRAGNYRESDPTDAEDLYGRSKLLGEIDHPRCVTLRTSFIGRELSRKVGLLEWFLAQKGTVPGFRRAIFSGFTTLEMTRIIERIVTRFPQASGVYHVSSAPISKHDLLALIKARLRLDTEIRPDDALRCNRSLDSARFRRDFEYSPPTWEGMIQELADEHEAGASK
jgi:dTDP-4-dehydrorhamnose reductase